jgi:putative peptidoglycan lipid II flippase
MQDKSSGQTILKSSLKMALATLSSRLLGLVRELSMAAFFGANALTDAFLVAYRIPNLLRDLFAEGTFSAAFVPTFTEALKEGHQRARELLWEMCWLLGIVTGVISLIFYFFAAPLVTVFAPSFVGELQQFTITVNLTKIMSPFLLLVSLAALFMAVLNTLKIFFIPALAPALFNVVMIAAIWALPSFLKGHKIDPVYALGIGTMIGGVVQLAMQLPYIFKHALKPLWPKEWLSGHAKKIIGKMGPSLFGFAATQINLLINTILATGTVVGAVSWLNYAFRLFQFPIGILGVSIGGSNLVHFSEAWKNGDQEKAVATLKSSYLLSMVTLFLALGLLMGLAEPMVNLVYQRGRWLSLDTQNTTLALQWYLAGLPFYGLYKLFVPTFYTIDRHRIPVICSIGSIVLNIVFCLVFTKHFGFAVLAAGVSLSMAVNISAQAYFLKKDLKLSPFFFFDWTMVKIFAASFTTFLFAQNLGLFFYNEGDGTLMKLGVFLTISLAGILAYGVMLWLLKENQLIKCFLNRSK